MLYPIMLNVENRRVVVVGGGKVALRKVKGLLVARANITVVSPTLCAGLVVLVNEEKVTWQKEVFSSTVLKEAVLVFAATNDRNVNKQVLEACKSNQLVNIVDNPDKSNFHVPAIYKKGRLTIAVSTNGASPIVARKLVNQIGETFEQNNIEDYLDFLFEARQRIKSAISDENQRKAILQELANGFGKDLRELEKIVKAATNM